MNIIDLSIKRPKTITMITLFLIVLGFLGLKNLSVDLYPNVSYPVLVVRAEFPGAAPEEVERLITEKMEDVLSTLSGLNTLRSVSRDGMSLVIMEFDSGVDVRFQELQVRGKIANLRNALPDDMREPEIYRQDPDDSPIIEIAVTGDKTASELTEFADKVLARRLRQVPFVGEVELSGERREEIKIELNPQALERWNINPMDVRGAIQNMNRSDPIGKGKGQNRVWLIRSTSSLKSLADFGDIPVAKSANKRPIYLRDIASITKTFAEETRVTRFGSKDGSNPAIIVSVLKQSGANTVKVSDQIQKEIEMLSASLPSGVELHVIRDNAELVRSNVFDVYKSLIIGSLLTVLVVLLFLRSIRSTITTAISLPSSVITTFAIMFAFDFTINVMSLMALSLAIGLLVDDAIVVRENIVRHLGKKSPIDAARDGAKEVSLAVIATTLTIAAVFLPVGFMSGVTGQFFKQFALTVVFAVLVSLYDALTMAPMLSAYFANIADPRQEWRVFGTFGVKCDQFLERFEHKFDALSEWYGRILKWIIPRPKVALGIAFLTSLVAVFGFIGVKKSFVPTQFGYVFSANLSGPLAIPLSDVTKISDLAEERLRKIEGLKSWTINAGTGFSGGANVGMTIKVDPRSAGGQTELSSIRDKVRDALKGIPGYTARTSEPSDPLSGAGGGRFQPLSVMIAGDDIETLRKVARDIRGVMQAIPGVTDVGEIQDEGLPEIRVTTLPLRAGEFGETADRVAKYLSLAVQGVSAGSLGTGDNQIPVRVTIKDGTTRPIRELLGASAGGGGVALQAATEVSFGGGSTMINRENRQRLIRVGGSLAPSAALGDVVGELQKRLSEFPLPKGYTARIAGQSEQMAELFKNVVQALGLGTLFVYMILVSLFESFVLPLSVMAAIPLAGIGAVLALLIFGLPLDLYGGVGLILLAGIVAKNSILLVDFASQKRRHDSLSAREAMMQAAPLRLRPIIMTSVAMIAGMLPIATALGSGGAARQSLGIATIGGVLSSTFLTLLVVPSLYIAIEDVTEFIKKKKLK